MIKTTRYGKTTVEKEFSDITSDITKAIKYIKVYSKGVPFSVECDTMDEAKALEDAGISKTISILVKEPCTTEIPAEPAQLTVRAASEGGPSRLKSSSARRVPPHPGSIKSHTGNGQRLWL